MDINVISHGMDFLRVRAPSLASLEYLQREMPYIDITPVWHHGVRYVDLGGKALSTVRVFDDLVVLAYAFADMFGLGRIDYYVDVEGRHLADVKYRSGTVIMNNGSIETVYSHHLKDRGDKLEFCRAYDARAAGHYDFDATRFEVEWKNDAVRTICSTDDWCEHLIEYAVGAFETLLDVGILVPGVESVELNPKRTVLEHSRERFYKRYGKGILSDIETMGLQGLQKFVQDCVNGGRDENKSN